MVRRASELGLSKKFRGSYLRERNFSIEFFSQSSRVMSNAPDANVARLRAHQQNVERYQRLLKTKLTDLETKFLEKRLSEEQSGWRC